MFLAKDRKVSKDRTSAFAYFASFAKLIGLVRPLGGPQLIMLGLIPITPSFCTYTKLAKIAKVVCGLMDCSADFATFV